MGSKSAIFYVQNEHALIPPLCNKTAYIWIAFDVFS